MTLHYVDNRRAGKSALFYRRGDCALELYILRGVQGGMTMHYTCINLHEGQGGVIMYKICIFYGMAGKDG